MIEKKYKYYTPVQIDELLNDLSRLFIIINKNKNKVKDMSYTNKKINNDGLIIEMFRYDILPIMEFLYKYENVNGFGINIYYNKITDVETIDIEVFTRHTDIINELLALNCFTEEDILQVFEEDIRWFQLPWMNRFFGSFNEEYQLYKRKRNIEKL